MDSERMLPSENMVSTDQELIKLRLENHVHNLIENVYDCAYIADNDGYLYFVNEAMVKTLGYNDRGELLGKNLARDLYFDSADREKFLAEVRKTGYVKDYEVTLVKKNGQAIEISTTSNFMKDREGNVIGIEGVFRDITRRNDEERRIRKCQEELNQEKKKLEQVLSIDQKMSAILNLNHLVDFIIDKAVDILNVERCSLMLFDSDNDELLIRGAKGLEEEVIRTTRIKMGTSVAGRVARDKKALYVRDIEANSIFTRKNNPIYKNNSFISTPILVQKKLVGVVNVADKKVGERAYDFLNITDLRILNMIIRQAAIAIENANYFRELEYLSVSDPLTGLYNYRYFIRRLDQEIYRKQRYGNPLSLLMLDVDNFKSYNDAFGHLEGDFLLKEIGMILIEVSRKVDVVCRYAGDEFAIILPETDISQASSVADKIQEAMRRCASKRPMVLSIGAAEYHQNGSRYDLISKADQSLYEAKKRHKILQKNTFTFPA